MNKQIEELANKLEKYCTRAKCKAESCSKCRAKYLIKQGYQKVDKDKQVVLSKEEYDNLKLEIQKAHNKGVRVGFDLTKYKENSIEQARKETAREILHKIYEQLSKYEAVNEIDYDCWVDDVLYEIAKQYGVEVDSE